MCSVPTKYYNIVGSLFSVRVVCSVLTVKVLTAAQVDDGTCLLVQTGSGSVSSLV